MKQLHEMKFKLHDLDRKWFVVGDDTENAVIAKCGSPELAERVVSVLNFCRGRSNAELEKMRLEYKSP